MTDDGRDGIVDKSSCNTPSIAICSTHIVGNSVEPTLCLYASMLSLHVHHGKIMPGDNVLQPLHDKHHIIMCQTKRRYVCCSVQP